MIIDINMHHLPEDLFTNEKVLDGFLSTAPRAFGEIASLETLANGKRHLILEKPKGYQNLNYVEGDYSLEAKIQAMDDAGVDKGILRVPVGRSGLGLILAKSSMTTRRRCAKNRTDVSMRMPFFLPGAERKTFMN